MVGGALKVVDPSGTVGAARALGLAVGDGSVRVLAAGEVVLGGVALAVSAPWIAALVAASYVGFAGLTGVALARRLPIDSCGCLGRLETPPSWRHLLVLVAVAGGSVGSVLAPRPALLERVGDGGAVFVLVTLLATLGAVVSFRSGRRPV